MRRRDLLAFAAAAIGGSLTAPPTGASDLRRVGFLTSGTQSAFQPGFERFRRRMAELGYSEDTNIAYELRFAEGHFDHVPRLARELVALAPNALLVATSPANLAVKAATTKVPVVMVAVADPVGVGLAQSLARPGGNFTGITNIAAELAGKRLEIIKEILPGARRVAVLGNPDDPIFAVQLRYAEAAAPSLQIELQPVLEVHRAEDNDAAFAAAVRAGAAAAIRFVDSMGFSETVAAAAKHRLPCVYASPDHVAAGGLVSYGADFGGQYGQAATFIDKILKGAQPADLPIEQPTKFALVINLKTAKALGLTVPPSLLARADEVIE
jgi:putative ABC transport system substrate-binding protein